MDLTTTHIVRQTCQIHPLIVELPKLRGCCRSVDVQCAAPSPSPARENASGYLTPRQKKPTQTSGWESQAAGGFWTSAKEAQDDEK